MCVSVFNFFQKTTHNPRKAWGTHAPRRVFSIPSKIHIHAYKSLKSVQQSLYADYPRKHTFEKTSDSLKFDCLCRFTTKMVRPTRLSNRLSESPPPSDEIVMADTSPTNKRTTPEQGKSVQKKPRATLSLSQSRGITP